MSGCAQNGTVVATPLPPHSLPIILTLARSAAAAGFPCIVVQPFVTLSAPFDPLLSPLPAPDPPLLPRSRWCNASKKSEYWRRLSSLHRMLLWRTLLDRGLNVLGVDAERRLVRNPLPAIAALRTRDEAQYGLGAPPDVLGGAPGWYLKEYYLHTVWLRACDATRALLRRAEARVRGASDQTIFSEELNWGAGSNASCCHSACLSAQFTAKPVVRATRLPPTTCAFDDAPPLAPPPPNGTRHNWPKSGTRRWRPDAYNDLKIPLHRFGRCTGRDVSCDPIYSHSTCPPAPPPFTREIANAGRRRKKG